MNHITVTRNPFGGRRIISKHKTSQKRSNGSTPGGEGQETTTRRTARGEGREWQEFLAQEGLQDLPHRPPTTDTGTAPQPNTVSDDDIVVDFYLIPILTHIFLAVWG